MKPDQHRPSEAASIEATAAAWLIQRDDGLTPEQAAEFAQWCSADVRHAAAFARLEKTWGALQQLREFRPEAARHPDGDLLLAPGKSPRVLRFPIRPVVAALAASLVLAAGWWYSGAERLANPVSQRYATTADGFERVSLSDGSLVELNSASEVSVRFTPTKRRVRLVRGEAHFTVARNAARPFSVEAGTLAVHAVGTAFNVRLGSSEVEVLVTQGKVELKQEAGPVFLREPAQIEDNRLEREARTASGGDAAFLTANERVVISTARPPASTMPVAPPAIEKLEPAAVRAALSWQEPRLVFVDTPLADAIAQFNRRSAVQIELADAELGTLPISGSFRPEHVDAFVRLLESADEVVAERPDAARIVLRKAK
jgi:transmembrane sensor